jgi:hypothetical protein
VLIAAIRAAGVTGGRRKTSLHGIAKALNKRGIPTATGRGRWAIPQVRRVLARPKA